MQNKVQKAFIAVFMLMITMPFIAYLFLKPYLDTENYENRTLTTFNDVLNAELSKKPMKLEALLNDNAPFKNQFLKLNAAINFNIFKCVQNSEVLLGNESWLFYKNVSDSKSLDDYQGINAYTSEQLAEICGKVNELNELLKSRGTRFCLLIAPNKERVYSRYMPSGVPVIANARADVLYDYLIKNSSAEIFYPRNELLTESFSRQVYYKYDTHWNSAGALIALKQLSPAFGNCTAAPAKGEALMDLAYLSALYTLLPPDSYYEIIGAVPQTGEKLLMLHDSFGDALIPWLEKAYKASFVHSSAFNTLNISQNADIFIIETAERYLDNLGPRLDSLIYNLK